MAHGFEDTVADSEDDESFLPPIPTKQTPSSIQTATDVTANESILPSNISAFTITERTNTSAINSFTSNPNASVPVGQQSVKPRPKPRPRIKKSINASESSSSGPLPSIEDAPAPRILSSIEDFSAIAPTIADRAKSRSRKSTQKSTISNIIDIPSDSEDELRLLPSSGSRSITANSKPNKFNDIIEIPDTQPTLPMPTSDIQPNPPSNNSQLPPSDPISTQDSKSKGKGRASITPSPPIGNKKRRRTNRIDDEEEDSRMMPPPGLPYREPSPFFAPPSSASSVLPTTYGSPTDPDVEEAPQKKAKNATKKKKKFDDDDDEFEVGSSTAQKRKQKGPARSRKKKVTVESQKPEQTFKSAEFILDSDEEGGGTLPQPKPVSTASTSPADLVEVVISKKRLSSASDLTKGATKGKKRRKTDEDEAEYGGEVPDDKVLKPKTERTKAANGASEAKAKAKAKQVLSEEEFEEPKENMIEPEEIIPVSEDHEPALPLVDTIKQNTRPPETKPASSSRPVTPSVSNFARLNYRHSIASEQRPTSMSDLIRKVNSISGSNSASPVPVQTYSPLLKSSRSALRKIAPLHPNRKTPPPLPPKPPPPKKTKKQLELEEKWEEELEDSIEGWASLTTEERGLLRKAKRDREMGWED